MPKPFQLPVLPPDAVCRLTPTDVSQFVLLEQCERFLRLRLSERAGHRFLEEAGVAVQRLPPLMSRSGREFEQRIERELAARFPCIHFAMKSDGDHARLANNLPLCDRYRRLTPGETVLLFQTRLEVALGRWLLRGDIDLIKLTRSADGPPRVLITDMKSTTGVKVEHRLQVAFYQLMLEAVFCDNGLSPGRVRTGILYRPPIECPEEDADKVAAHRANAGEEYGLTDVLLELVADPDAYLSSARDLVLNSDSVADRVAGSSLNDLAYTLSYKCDQCSYTEFCMKSAAEAEDLSLLPYMTGTDKEALRRNGITTIRSLATLKRFAADDRADLIAEPGREAEVKRLAATWPVGPRLDELIHRAKCFRRSARKDDIRSLPYIPDKGNSTLPVSQPDLNPNLVWLYLDAQFDPLEGRVYMLGALAVACQDGQPVERRSIVQMTDGPPDSDESERGLFRNWTRELLRTVLDVARSNQSPKQAPIHVVFFNRHEQRVMLAGLARNFPAMLEHTPPLYDFLTQIAPYDSPIASFIDEEARASRNYPMTCQSLQSLATYLKFSWNEPLPFRELFRARMFDYLGKLEIDGESEWYTKRSRFGSGIPAEYAYAAWNLLPQPEKSRGDEFAEFRPVTREVLLAFQQRRLEAIEHVAARIPGNRYTTKTPLTLPDVGRYDDKARDLAGALAEFVRIERLVSLGEWKSARHARPEVRALHGECLIARYVEADQDPQVADENRDHERRRQHLMTLKREHQRLRPGQPFQLTKEQKAGTKWTSEGLKFKLRLETADVDCDLHELLLLTNLREGEQVVVFPRWDVDERLTPAEQKPYTPTPKQLLYGQRAALVKLAATEKDDSGRITAAIAEIELRESHGNDHTRPYVFGGIRRPFIDGELYTLDPCPNEWYSYWCSKVVQGLCDGAPNSLYDRLVGPPHGCSASGRPGQVRFLAGLDAFRDAGLLHDFEPGKREYIGGHATTPVLMVQGPPGTGKSYSTAFAVFARLQAAMADGREFRAFVTCKTHAATDVLLHNILAVRTRLRELRGRNPDLFAAYFDERLLSVPLFRVAPKEPQPDDIRVLPKDAEKARDEAPNVDRIGGSDYAVVGITPGGTYSMLKQKRPQELFGQELCDLLVLDEASQMNLPEALMAALPLKPDAPIIVVGDHRQMPPIVKHDWEAEARRTFREYRAYRSLFDTLRSQQPPPPMIRFAESFRLHAAMAEFLRREVYRHDGIDFHSNKSDRLAARPLEDEFTAAVLRPEYPLVAVVHEECGSQVRNPFEMALIGPIVRALADPSKYGLDPADGLGVVVPHRAQRAALQQEFPELNVLDLATGLPARSAVDTVERFQGGERTVILVSATESDRGYLLASAGFLLDPRRLTVAVSRAKLKMILVASRNVFSIFSPEEETFGHAQLWKNLLTVSCPATLWQGRCHGVSVVVRGGGVGPA